MNIETLCLAILSFGEATGYDIRNRASEGPFSYFLECSYGSIYPALNRLWQEGLIERRKEVHPGRPSRNVYALNQAGWDVLVETLHQPLKPDVFKSEFLLAAMMAEHIDPDHMARLIAAKLTELERRLKKMREAMVTCENEPMRWVLSYGITIHKAAISFLQQADRQSRF